MVDRYTKAILTLIGVALCVLVVQNFMRPASALGESNCGHSFSPCVIQLQHSGTVILLD